MSMPLTDSITVWAMCRQNPAGMEFKGVDTPAQTLIFSKTFETGDVDTGNFLAIVHALKLLSRNKLDVAVIYTNSNTAIRWVKNKNCDCKPVKNKKEKKLSEAVRAAEKWLSGNDYSTKILKWNINEWGDIFIY